MDVRKFQRVPPFYIFRHCDTVQKSHFKIFLGNFFQSLNGPPLQFFSYFATSWSFTKPKGSPFYIFRHCDTVQFIFFIFCLQLEFHKTQRVPPFTILSLRYSADFGRSRLVFFTNSAKSPRSPWSQVTKLLFTPFSETMAQLVVRLPARYEVVGSNPGWSVIFFIAENIPVISGRLVFNQ